MQVRTLPAFAAGPAALALAAAALGLAAPAVHADTTVYSTFGPNDTSSAGATYLEEGPNGYYGRSFGAISDGFGFSPSATGTLTSLTADILHLSGSNTAHFYLTDSATGLGDTTHALAAFTFTGLPTNQEQVLTATASQSPVLTAGDTYYVYELETGSDTDEWTLSLSNSGTDYNAQVHGRDVTKGDYMAYSNGQLPAFRVQADVASTPEPSQLAPFGLVAAALAGLIRRARTRRNAAA